MSPAGASSSSAKSETSDANAPAPAFGGLDPKALALGGRREENLVDTRSFTLGMAVLVVVNLITIGLETDIRSGIWPQVLEPLNGAFILIYIGETVLRLLTHGPAATKDVLNVLDALLVMVTFVERAISNSGFSRALPAFRLLRVLRLTKDLKALRGEKELWVLVTNGRLTAITLGWVSLILFTVLLSAASFARYFIGYSAEWTGTMDPMVDHDFFESFDNHEYFGSVSRSFLTLLQVVTLSQWADVARRVVLVYPLLLLFFLSFIFVTSYGVVNCIISNVVQESIAAARIAEEIAESDAREVRTLRGRKALVLLRQADRDGDGICTVEEIEKAMIRTELGVIFDELNVPDFRADGIVRLFDRDGKGQVTNEDIVDGLVRMDEDVKKKDYLRLAMWSANCLMRAKALKEKVTVLSEKVSDLRITLERAMQAMEYFRHTKESTQLRFRAFQMIKSAPPAEAPRLRGWKPPVEPKFPPEDEAKMFMEFTKRFMGAGAGSPDSPDGFFGPRYTGQKTELPPAPPRLAVSRAMVRQEDEIFKDKYWPTPDPENYDAPGPSPSLRSLRELLS